MSYVGNKLGDVGNKTDYSTVLSTNLFSNF